jgi:hypothetical protein
MDIMDIMDIRCDVDVDVGGWTGLDRQGYKDIHSTMYDVRA